MTINEFKNELHSLLEKFNKENQCVINEIELSQLNTNNVNDCNKVHYGIELTIKSR